MPVRTITPKKVFDVASGKWITPRLASAKGRLAKGKARKKSLGDAIIERGRQAEIRLKAAARADSLEKSKKKKKKKKKKVIQGSISARKKAFAQAESTLAAQNLPK